MKPAPWTTEAYYKTKAKDYFTSGLAGSHAFLPQKCRRPLDVGCGATLFGEMVRQSRKEVWEVEPPDQVVVDTSLPALWRLVGLGRWKYEDCGVLDISTFYKVEHYHDVPERRLRCGEHFRNQSSRGDPQSNKRLWAAHGFVDAIFFQKFDDLRFQQFVAVAQPTPTLPSGGICTHRPD